MPRNAKDRYSPSEIQRLSADAAAAVVRGLPEEVLSHLGSKRGTAELESAISRVLPTQLDWFLNKV